MAVTVDWRSSHAGADGRSYTDGATCTFISHHYLMPMTRQTGPERVNSIEEFRRSAYKEKKGGGGEELIRNRREHTHILVWHHGPRMLSWRANDRARWNGWGTFSFWQRGEKGEHNEREKGWAPLRPGFQPANVRSRYGWKVQVWSEFGDKKGPSTNSDFLRIDSSLQQRHLPGVQLLLRTAGQLQAFVVFVHIPAN